MGSGIGTNRRRMPENDKGKAAPGYIWARQRKCCNLTGIGRGIAGFLSNEKTPQSPCKGLQRFLVGYVIGMKCSGMFATAGSPGIREPRRVILSAAYALINSHILLHRELYRGILTFHFRLADVKGT